jgi:acyl-CoA thioesterase
MARLRRAFAAVPYARLLGVELVSAARGEATLALETREELLRMGGMMHGGALASLLDTAAAFAAISLAETSERTVTIDLNVHFLRPVSTGRVEARAHVLREGRRVLIIEVQATDPAGKLIAVATTTYIK